MKHPNEQDDVSHNRHHAVTKLLSLIGAAVLVSFCLLGIGCDMGTYNERLKETPAAPAEDTSAENADSSDGDETSDDQ